MRASPKKFLPEMVTVLDLRSLITAGETPVITGEGCSMLPQLVINAALSSGVRAPFGDTERRALSQEDDMSGKWAKK